MIDTDPKKIHELLSRGVEQVYPNREFVEKLLASGRRLRVYCGFDPTAPTLHIGHAVQLRKLRQLQDLGHEVILLIGDFTARIGDPDKLSARKKLSEKEVKANLKAYKAQMGKIVRLSGRNAAEIKYNAKWLSKLSFADILELASNITHSQIIKRSMFQERIKNNGDIFVNEFLYPLMQGYDSVALDVDGEVGGSDQIFNMLVGRDLLKKIKNKEKFVIADKLLEDPSGKKMGKTEGNMVALSDNPDEMFGKIMSWTDGMILPGFELCTAVPTEEIKKIQKNLDDGANPRDAKIRLAGEVVAIFHGPSAAEKAERNFAEVFKKGGLPEEIETIQAEAGRALIDILAEAGIVASKSELRRLAAEGAVSNAETGEKISDPAFKIEKSIVLKVGKKRFLKIVL